MTFWTDNNFEPKQDHQFMVFFQVLGTTSQLGWSYVISTDRPSYQINEKVYKLINTQKKYPTNVVWSDITMELVDTADNRALYFLENLFKYANEDVTCAGYSNSDGVFYSSPEKQKIGRLQIELMIKNKEGATVEKWTLKNPWIKSMKQNQLSYQNDNISKINIAISYDSATVELIQLPTDIEADLAFEKLLREEYDRVSTNAKLITKDDNQLVNSFSKSNFRDPTWDPTVDAAPFFFRVAPDPNSGVI